MRVVRSQGPTVSEADRAELVRLERAPATVESTGLTAREVFVGRDARTRPTTSPATTYLGQLTPRSRSQVRQRLATIAELVAGEPVRPEDAGWHVLRYEHTQAIRAALCERFAPASVNVYLAALRGVLRECFRLGLIDHDQHQRAIAIDNVKGETLPAGRALQPGELRALFASCNEEGTPSAVRDAAMLAILYGAGVRRDEAAGLEVADYRPDPQTLAVRRGKGGKQRVVSLPSSCLRAVDRWLEVRGDEPGPLLCPVDRWGRVDAARPLSLRAINKRLAARARAAGVEHFTPHDMRRSHIGDMLDAGADVATVAKQVGHASVRTTGDYDRRGADARARAVELLHVPVDG